MLIINYIPKVQAIDKSTAILAQIKMDVAGVKVYTIVNIEEKNQIEKADELFHLLSVVSDIVFFYGHKRLHLNAFNNLSDKEGCNYILLDDNTKILFEHLSKKIQEINNPIKYFLIPYTGEGSNVGVKMEQYLKKKKFKTISYFKSLHDQGLGLTSKKGYSKNENHTLINNLKKFKNKFIFQSENKRKNYKISEQNIDILLAFNQDHKRLISNKVRAKSISISGYQLAYVGWKELVQKYYGNDNSCNNILKVVLFTRGETPGRPPNENVVSHKDLKELMNDVFSGLDELNRPYEIIIKPHPIQDVEIVKSIINSRNVNSKNKVKISFSPPSVLVNSADLAISTYSSTVIDALIFGVPSIEYFYENEFFKNKHPLGSPFIDFGVLKARSKSEFKTSLKLALNKELVFESVEAVLDQKSNLNFLIDESLSN